MIRLLLKLLNVNAIVIYPWVFYSTDKPNKYLVNHEEIHLQQMYRDGVLKFYLIYLLDYFSLRLKGFNHNEAYYAIPYEIEAHENQLNLNYRVKQSWKI